MNKVQIFCIALTITGAFTLATDLQSFASPADSFAQLQARASAWFKTSDKKSRRKEMRVMTRALKQPCKYCHAAGFKGYTDRHKISLEMMALSAEHDVACKDCHLGKKALSRLGNIAKRMETISRQEKAECNDCHVQKAKFKSLTTRGNVYKQLYPDLLLEFTEQEKPSP